MYLLEHYRESANHKLQRIYNLQRFRYPTLQQLPQVTQNFLQFQRALPHHPIIFEQHNIIKYDHGS